MKRFLLPFLIAAAAFLTMSVYAASLTRVRIDQTVQQDSLLYIILHAVDQDDNAITGLTEENIRVDLGGRTLPISVEQENAGGTGYVFCIDVSASLSAEQFGSVQACMRKWVDAMGGSDQAAIVTFGDYVEVAADFTGDQNALHNVINGLQATHQTTSLYSGVMRAVDIAKRGGDSLPLQRVIILMSDGVDESRDAVGFNEMRTAAVDAGVPLYTVGVTTSGNSGELAALGEMSRSTGGKIYTADKDGLAYGFDSLNAYIHAGANVVATIPAELADGGTKGLVVTVAYDGVSAENSRDIRVNTVSTPPTPAPESAEVEDVVEETPASTPKPTPEPEPEPTPEPEPERRGYGSLLLVVFALLLVAAVAAYIVLDRRKAREARNPDTGWESEFHDTPQPASDRVRAGRLSSIDPTITKPSGDDSLGVTVRQNKCEFGEGSTVIIRPGQERVKRLVLTETDSGQRHYFNLQPRISVGRMNDNEIVISNESVSRHHCAILFEGDRMSVMDLGSANGTNVIRDGLYLRVDRDKPQSLFHGDELVLGNTHLEVAVE